MDEDAGKEQFPNDNNLPNDQESPSTTKSLLSSTPENSPKPKEKFKVLELLYQNPPANDPCHVCLKPIPGK